MQGHAHQSLSRPLPEPLVCESGCRACTLCAQAQAAQSMGMPPKDLPTCLHIRDCAYSATTAILWKACSGLRAACPSTAP